MNAESQVVTNGAGDVRRAHLEAQLARVADARRSLAREGRRMPWLALTAVLAVPAGLRWGIGAALLALVASATLALLGAYISWAHRQEYSDAETVIRQQLASLGRSRPRGTPWRVPGKPMSL